MFLSVRGLAVIGCCLGLILIAAPAQSNDKAKAKEHFKIGLSLLDKDDLEGAAAEFEKSVKLFPTKNGLFNLANCYKALYRYAEAINQLENLKQKFKNKLDKNMRQALGELEKAIRETGGELIIHVNQPGAKVLLDNRPVAESPLIEPVIMDPGEHEVTVLLDGYEVEKRKVNVVLGAKKLETFELVKTKDQATLDVTVNVQGAEIFVDGEKKGETPFTKPLRLSPGEHVIKIVHEEYKTAVHNVNLATGDRAAMPVELVQKKSPQADSQEPTKMQQWLDGRVWTWVAFGVGGAAGIGAIVTGSMQLNKTSDIKDECEDNVCPKKFEDDRDKAHTLGTVTNVLIGVAAAGIVAGTVLAFFEPIEKSEEENVALKPSVSPDGAGLVIMGRF